MSPSIAVASTIGMNISDERSSRLIGLRARIEQDRPDDAVRRHLERHLVADLVDTVRGSLVVARLGQRIVAGQDEDEVVRIDVLRPGAGTSGAEPSIGAQRTSTMVERFALVERIRQPAVDQHPADQAPILGQSVERDALLARRRRPPPARLAADAGSFFRFRKSNGTSFLRGARVLPDRIDDGGVGERGRVAKRPVPRRCRAAGAA